LNGELTVKRLERHNEQWQLKAENPAYADIIIHEELELVIWGVVTGINRSFSDEDSAGCLLIGAWSEVLCRVH